MKDLDGNGEEKNAVASKKKTDLADVAKKLEEEEKAQEATQEEKVTDKKKVKNEEKVGEGE
ncbi:MAG: hypothetical protein LBG59_03135 [Candidatus Peribacteria bacterium]|jgi:hypothetical protein|nr:hypothetical protein [Candidatus Peribacteria bacterium]